MFKEKWHYANEISSNLVKKNKDSGVSRWFDELFLHLKSQIESDEAYFSKFFSNEGQKYKSDSEEIVKFMDDVYKDFTKRFDDFLNNLFKISPFVIFILEIRVKSPEIQGEDTSKSFSKDFFKNLQNSIGKMKERNLKQLNDYLEGIDVVTKYSGVLSPVKRIIVIFFKIYRIRIFTQFYHYS